MITREQFETIRQPFDTIRKTTRPRRHDLYDVFNAVLFFLKDPNTAWRTLPDTLPPWRTVHEYFKMWTVETTLGRSLLYDALINLKLYDEATALGRRLNADRRYIKTRRYA